MSDRPPPRGRAQAGQAPRGAQGALAPAAVLALAAAAGGLGLGGRLLAPVAADDRAPDALEALARPVPVDEFNPDVTAKDGSESKPVRGDVLRVRSPGDPKSLNPLCDNDAPTQQVYQYLGERLAHRDRETFEWLPALARWWETRDTVTLTDGHTLAGRVLEERDDAVVFAVGAARVTLADCDLERFEAADGQATAFQAARTSLPAGPGRLVARPGTGIPPLAGTLSRPPAGRYTVWLDTTPDVVRTIPRAEVAVVLEGEEGARIAVPAVRREVDFVLHLREGVRWHDGQPLGVADVEFTFTTAMNPAVDSAEARQKFVDLASWRARDERSVHFRFKRQFFGAFGSVAFDTWIYPRHRFQPERFEGAADAFGKHFNAHKDHQGPVGAGPYRFVKWARGQQLEVARFDGWWASPPPGPDGRRPVVVPWIDPERPYLDVLRWIFINDKQAAVKALEKGDVDADFDIEPTTWGDPATSRPDFVRRVVRARFLQPLYTYIGWNQRRKDAPPERQFFADRRVRQAMSHLVPKRRIMEEIHLGLAELVTGPFFAGGPFNDPTLAPVEENLRRARLLLDEAGWIDHDGDGVRDRDGVPFEFEYVIHNMRDYHQKIADINKEAIERAGVRMVIRKLDWGVFVDTVLDQKFDAVRFAWGEPSCIDTDPYQIWHSSQAQNRGSNYVSFRDEEVDRLIVEARRTLDLPERQRLLRRVHRKLHREQPYTFMFNFYALYFYARHLRNVRFTLIGEDPFLWSEWYVPKALQDPRRR